MILEDIIVISIASQPKIKAFSTVKAISNALYRLIGVIVYSPYLQLCEITHQITCLNESVETNVENMNTPAPSFHKMLQEGQLLIQHEDKTYNVIGMEVGE